MGQSESTYDFDFADNKNNATVGNYPGSPAIISQPQTYGGGGHPNQQDSFYGQQQKDGYYGGAGGGGGYDGYNPNLIQGGGGTGAQYPPVGQYGTPYHQPSGAGFQGPPPPGGPPPPYQYHQQPAPGPGGYFPATHQFQGDGNLPYYNPNAQYPPNHAEQGKY